MIVIDDTVHDLAWTAWWWSKQNKRNRLMTNTYFFLTLRMNFTYGGHGLFELL